VITSGSTPRGTPGGLRRDVLTGMMTQHSTLSGKPFPVVARVVAVTDGACVFCALLGGVGVAVVAHRPEDLARALRDGTTPSIAAG
jgi:hypothetical protein